MVAMVHICYAVGTQTIIERKIMRLFGFTRWLDRMYS